MFSSCSHSNFPSQGIYPHEPKKKRKLAKGSSAPKTFYYVKDIMVRVHEIPDFCHFILAEIREIDILLSQNFLHKIWHFFIQYLAHEPILEKFRETKIFVKKIKKALGREEYDSAHRARDQKPHYTLDHIVKERYEQCFISTKMWNNSIV